MPSWRAASFSAYKLIDDLEWLIGNTASGLAELAATPRFGVLHRNAKPRKKLVNDAP
jgi:hypothetical protein